MATKKILTRDDAIEILSMMAKASLVDILDSELNIDAKKLKKHKHALRELTIKPTKDGNQLQIKMYDKKAIIEQLANLQGWKDYCDKDNVDTLKEFLTTIIGDRNFVEKTEKLSNSSHFKVEEHSYEA